MDPNRTEEPNRVPDTRQRRDAPPRNSLNSGNGGGDRQPQNRRNDPQRPDSPTRLARNADDANRAQSSHPVPRHGNPEIRGRQGRPEHSESSPNQNPTKPPTHEHAG
jgi:hypothetical protein